MPKARRGEAIAWLRAAVANDTDECQFWPADWCRTPKGYGKILWGGRTTYIHHVALLLAGSLPPIPPMETRHLCGNGNLGCVTVRHLVVGTRAENCADRVAHGTTPRGERHGGHKLTALDVAAIRAATGETQIELARRYGVTQPTICNIRRGKTWKPE